MWETSGVIFKESVWAIVFSSSLIPCISFLDQQNLAILFTSIFLQLNFYLSAFSLLLSLRALIFDLACTQETNKCFGYVLNLSCLVWFYGYYHNIIWLGVMQLNRVMHTHFGANWTIYIGSYTSTKNLFYPYKLISLKTFYVFIYFFY